MVLARVHITLIYCASFPQNRFYYCNSEIVVAHFRSRLPGDKLLSWHSSLLKPTMITNESSLKCSSKQYVRTKAIANPSLFETDCFKISQSHFIFPGKRLFASFRGTEKDIKATRLNTLLLGNAVKTKTVMSLLTDPFPTSLKTPVTFQKTLTSLLEHTTPLYDLHYHLVRHMQ